MIPGHLPRRMPKRPQKSPLCIFFIKDGRHHVTPFSKKQGYILFLTFAVRKKYSDVSTYVLRHKEFIQMIRSEICTFLNTKNPRWPPYCSEYVKRSLKKRKYEVTISLLNLKCILWPNPWDLALIWVTNILLYSIYQHKSHTVVNSM